MTVQELFRAGELKQAIQALNSEVRDKPSDIQRRTFLFELLCFAGEYSRAEKQLTVLADKSEDALVGGLLYRSALVAERKRVEFFASGQYKVDSYAPEPVSGKLNGEAFQTFEDADPRIGARLELFIAGEYVWLPFAHVGKLEIAKAKLLRDLLWATADLTGSSAMQAKDFGEILLPVLCPASFQHPSDAVKLGRATEWIDDTPYGQKLYLVDGERVVSFLEIKTLEFDSPEAETPPTPLEN